MCLPKTFPDGPYKGSVLNKEKFKGLLEEYYELRGWNKETSIPKKDHLIDLGPDFAAEELERMGKY